MYYIVWGVIASGLKLIKKRKEANSLRFEKLPSSPFFTDTTSRRGINSTPVRTVVYEPVAEEATHIN